MNLAFYMGMAAVFSPCGIALLPASFAWVGGVIGGTDTVWTRVGRGVQAGVLMGLGFTVVVAVLALVLHMLGSTLSSVMRLVMIVLGGFLVLGGGAVAVGMFHVPLDRWTGLARVKPSRWIGVTVIVTGMVYGVAALSCTLPLFVAALAPALLGGWLQVGQLVGGFGLGTVLVMVAIAWATLFARDAVVRGVRTIGPWLNPALGVIIIGAGGYLLYYWIWGPGHFLALT
jgi:cytochrome c biogenesis protein CcdA